MVVLVVFTGSTQQDRNTTHLMFSVTRKLMEVDGLLVYQYSVVVIIVIVSKDMSVFVFRMYHSLISIIITI